MPLMMITPLLNGDDDDGEYGPIRLDDDDDSGKSLSWPTLSKDGLKGLHNV